MHFHDRLVLGATLDKLAKIRHEVPGRGAHPTRREERSPHTPTDISGIAARPANWEPRRMTAPTPAIVRPAARRRALRRDLRYRSGRSKSWIKIKNPASPAVLRVGRRSGDVD